MAIDNLYYSFVKGVEKVPKEYYKEAQDEIFQFLGCSSIQHYYRLRKSYRNMPAHIKAGIEKILGKYKVSPEEIWETFQKSDVK